MTQQINITVNQQTFTATLEDNAASRALVAKMPFTLSLITVMNGEKK